MATKFLLIPEHFLCDNLPLHMLFLSHTNTRAHTLSHFHTCPSKRICHATELFYSVYDEKAELFFNPYDREDARKRKSVRCTFFIHKYYRMLYTL